MAVSGYELLAPCKEARGGETRSTGLLWLVVVVADVNDAAATSEVDCGV